MIVRGGSVIMITIFVLGLPNNLSFTVLPFRVEGFTTREVYDAKSKRQCDRQMEIMFN